MASQKREDLPRLRVHATLESTQRRIRLQWQSEEKEIAGFSTLVSGDVRGLFRGQKKSSNASSKSNKLGKKLRCGFT